MNVGIIGCGTIGSKLAEAIEDIEEIKVVYILDNSYENSKALSYKLEKVVAVKSLDDFIKDVILVIESASQEAVKVYADKILENGKDLIIMSVGALVDLDFYERLKNLAKEKNCNIYIPSGAICGIDGINSVSCNIDEIILTTTKPPKSFENVKYLQDIGIDLKSISEARVLFEGYAKDVVKLFPKNINVAATISLAGIGFEKTKVKIIADPNATNISHKIIVKGDFGKIETSVLNVPSPSNPQTSYLAVLSAISALKKIIEVVKIGN